MKRLTLSLLMSFAVMMCVAPCAFSLPLSPGDLIPSGDSDYLQVSFDSSKLVSPDTTNPQIRDIVEVPGEKVTEEMDFTIAETNAFDNFISDTDVYMVEPGATPNSDGSYTGDRSDIIRFHISHDTGIGVVELHFTILSDEEPGGAPQVTGYLENGLLQNITLGFGFGTLATTYGIQVLAGSDATPEAVPEPATMLLLGCGLIGLAGYGRKKLFKE